jgi:subtilisin family serine protease
MVDGRIGNIVSIRLPLDQAASLAEHPDIIGMSLAKSFRPTLDHSIPDTGGDFLRTRFTNGEFVGLTGKGSVVAIIDSGIDWQHSDFRKPDGSTRIKYLWDPSDPTYMLSNGTAGSSPPSGGQGTVYTEAQINDALQGIGTVYSNDECGHGTHVAGIAAGNGAASGGGIAPGTFVGMAPEADIVVVRVFGDDCAYLGQQINLIQAGAFVDQMAQTLGRPYVINLSLGTQIGGHDGYDFEEIAIDSLVGPGKPGKAVVVSAGNDSGRGAHTGGQFGSEGTTNQTIRIEATQKGPNLAIYDLWFHRGDNFTISLEGGGKPEEDITDWVGYAPLLRAKRLFSSPNDRRHLQLKLSADRF